MMPFQCRNCSEAIPYDPMNSGAACSRCGKVVNYTMEIEWMKSMAKIHPNIKPTSQRVIDLGLKKIGPFTVEIIGGGGGVPIADHASINFDNDSTLCELSLDTWERNEE